jgi:hypothetical protein
MECPVRPRCHLPRLTQDENVAVSFCTFFVRNYVHRIRLVRK